MQDGGATTPYTPTSGGGGHHHHQPRNVGAAAGTPAVQTPTVRFEATEKDIAYYRKVSVKQMFGGRKPIKIQFTPPSVKG